MNIQRRVCIIYSLHMHCLLLVVFIHVPCVTCMPGGVVVFVGDSGLCCCASLIRVTDVSCSNAINSLCFLMSTHVQFDSAGVDLHNAQHRG